MVPLSVLGGDVAGTIVLAGIVLAPGAMAAILWAPFLASSRIRSLFRRLPPTDSLAVSYLALVLAGSTPYVVGFVATLVWTVDSSGAVTANALLNAIVPLSLVYVVGFPVVTGLVLPRLGVDWDPTDYGLGTWAILVLGGVWYNAVFAVPLFLIALVMALPT